MFKNIKRGIKWSSSKSSYIQVLHQQIRGGGGSKSVLIALTQGGGGGGQNYGKHADVILERSLTITDILTVIVLYCYCVVVL